MNAMDSFIDFLKGVLRIEKEHRWTPLMAMEHPFITRQIYTGHFEPMREQDRKLIIPNDPREDKLSERS